MPFNGVIQPHIINIDDNLRLRAYDGDYLAALPWYQNPVVYYNSEGITDITKIPDAGYVKRMYDFFQNNGESELYFIEVKKNDTFVPIGDVVVQEVNPPIVIGVGEYRGCGIGKKVLGAMINRAREIGIKRFHNTMIYDYNVASQRLYESMGFRCVGKKDNEFIYEMGFCDD